MQRKTGNSNSILLSQNDLINVDDVVPGARCRCRYRSYFLFLANLKGVVG